MKSFYIPEPYLYFKDENRCIDPNVGLINYGPNGLCDENAEIEIGIIGTRFSKAQALQFIKRLQYEILGANDKRSNIRNMFFPGLDKNGPLGFYFTVREEYCETIPDNIIDLMKSDLPRQNKIEKAAQSFGQAIQDLSAIHPKPDLVLISIPKEILQACKHPNQKSDNIKLFERNYKNLKRLASMPEEEWPLLIDFHHYLKVLGFEYNLRTQLIKPKTLNFSSNIEDPATIAWNFVVASYYKSTGIPWKLADLEPETIHVGISFYNDLGRKKYPVVRTAIAQVYMKTGDSQVIRGIEIPIIEEEDRKLNISRQEAYKLLKQAINLYERQHGGNKPLRVVVHKKSMYTEDELEGFKSAAYKIELQDFLYISEFPELRVITPTDYPIARGTILHHKTDKINELYTFTTGYIPCYDTYPGNEVPIPLRVVLAENQSQEKQIAEDILNLTKLDWNSSRIAKRLPVTIAVSKKVGNIMGEITVTRRNIKLPTAYADYM